MIALLLKGLIGGELRGDAVKLVLLLLYDKVQRVYLLTLLHQLRDKDDDEGTEYEGCENECGLHRFTLLRTPE